MSQLLKPPAFCGAGDILYLNEDMRDAYVVVRTNVTQWKFPAHKLVLSTESAILRKHFEDPSVNEVILTDITPATAEHLMKYMYCGKLEVENWSEAIDLLVVAYKYLVHDLIERCGKFLEEVISLSNVCHIYEKASECNLNNLQDKCLKLILEAGFIVLKSEAFEILNKKCVLQIVSSPELNIDSELVVFQTLFRWARTECCRMGLPTTDRNIFTQIEPFLKHLCIEDMSDTDKSSLPPTILACVQPNNRNRIGYCIPESLRDCSKFIKFDIDRECMCHIGECVSSICFTVDTPVHLTGLRFFIAPNAQAIDLQVSMMKESGPKVTMFSQAIKSEIGDENSRNAVHPIHVMLKQPVHLKLGEVYNIYVMDETMEVQFPQSRYSSVKLPVASGILTLTVYDVMWGISNLYVI